MITKETKYNNLVNQKSPYLLQHAENPVEWYPWGDEAFKKAKEENKPIFLSIGYSTCHWCHVMAHESFEDEQVANLMNDAFISIKVDREERPDIDNVYMTVCQMLTGSGGWPLTIILTPDKKPFFAGTYFPKETRFGRIGLIDLIKQIKNLWKTKKEKLIDSAEQITVNLQNISSESPGNPFKKNILIKTFDELSLQFDSINGGFSNRPKFPIPHNLLFLLRFWKRTNKKEALEMVEKTLQSIRQGGVYDHVGYGIHRYSTDSKWLVPHFEKMLYDQALIAMVYLETYQATKNKKYAKVAQEIFTYVIRDMTSPNGGFYSAEDADSEGEEGKYYVWTKKELEKILNKEQFELVSNIYNIKEAGNYLEESTGKTTGNNIIHFKNSISNIAKEINLTEKELENRIEIIRQKLFQEREKRIRPHKDDKILTDWNGLMIVALAKGFQILQEPIYLKVAKKAVDFILKHLQKDNGRLLHRYREDNAEIEGLLTDYAFLVWGLIELYEASFDTKFLEVALDLNKIQIEHFWDDYIGGFYLTPDDGEELLVRQKKIYDGAIPSGNSVAMLNLLRLSYITGNHELEEKADILSRAFSERLENSPMAHTQFMIAADFAVGPTYSLVIAGDTRLEDTNKMIKAIRYEYLPNKVLLIRKMSQNPPSIDRISNLVQFFTNIDGKATAYVCINKTCKPATQDLSKILKYLKSEW
jgi:uncharacterized protein YyaL (SSP411 family)